MSFAFDYSKQRDEAQEPEVEEVSDAELEDSAMLLVEALTLPPIPLVIV